MDCDTARCLLPFVRPNVAELDAAELGALESHLSECADCRALNQQERMWDDRLTQAIRDVSIPVDGKERLDRRLRAERHRLRSRQCLQLAGIFLGMYGLWWLIPARSLNPEKIAGEAYQLVGNRESVEEWLVKQHRHFAFPPRMNAQFLIDCERRDFHGVTAPVLTFVRQNAIARVAVLTVSQFRNLKEMPEGRLAENSVCTLVLVADPDHPHVVFLVEVINGPVELFYHEQDAAVS